MNDDWKEPLAFFGGLSLFALSFMLPFVLICAMASCSGSYKQGQIDAIQGNVKYELRDQPDGSRVWVETERGK